MKEFQISEIFEGYQIHTIIVCKTKKDAAKQLDVSIHHLNTYGYCNEPKTEVAIKNPYQRFSYFDSGWLRERKPDWFRKIMPYQELTNYIHEVNRNNYNKLFKRKA